MFYKVSYYKPRHKKPRFKKWLVVLLYLFLAGIAFSAILFIYFSKDLPDPSKMAERQITQSTKIYDRTGTMLLYDVHGEEKRTIVPLDQISKSLQQATIATEDANFYQHFGLDFKGIARAVLGVLTGNRSAGGGSTITQQFIKKSLLTDERSYSRKIKEAILALELEAKYSKDEILGFYLNQIPYGSNAYGAEAAAQTFFGKPAKDLTLAESALLAALPKAPTYYSPFGSHPEDLKARQEYVLDRMQKLSYISPAQAEAAKDEKLVFSKERQSIKAPHFVMYVKEYLVEKYGEEILEQGGLKVYTTLDWDLQQAGQEIVEKGANDNQKKYGAYNAALTAIDPKSGQILVMVGSKNYFSDPLPEGCDPGKNCRFEPNVNVAIRDRQPGSSFKPFAYALAFEKGFLPQTTLFDLKTEFNPACPADATSPEFNGQKCYNPQNYDGNFHGPVSMRQALAQSLNIPAVKTLYLAGIPQTISLSQEMGITTLKDRDRYGLALVLGGGEVKLIDETVAYGVFAAEGIKNEKTAILKIEDANGKVLESFKTKPVQILEPQIARLISDVLSDNEARTPVFGSASPLYLPERQTAVKTGTTQEYRDAWTVGYTPSLSVGVWAGNNDNKPMAKAGAGLYAAAPIWNAFIKKAYELKTIDIKQISDNSFFLPKEPEQFTKPDPPKDPKPALSGQSFAKKIIKIDKVSGKLATDLTPPEFVEEKTFQEIHSILYYIDKDKPTDDFIGPTKDPQFPNWDAPIQIWAQNSGWSPQAPPNEYDDIHTQENQPTVSIISPISGAFINTKNITIYAQAQARLGIKQLDFFFDEEPVGVVNKEPYTLNFTLQKYSDSDPHTLKVRAYDQYLNRAESEIKIYLNY